MISFSGYYYNGKDSKRQNITAHLDGEHLVISSGGDALGSWSMDDVEVRRGVGSSPAHLFFPDGSSCETSDNDAVSRILAELDRDKAGTFVLMLEKKKRYVLASLLITVLIGAVLFLYGIPLMSKAAAFSLPAETNGLIGRNALELLDEHLFAPSTLEDGKQRDLTGLFASLRRGLPEGFRYRLVFRDGGKLGANAMALPDGTVIVTDELVRLAENDYETASVLAHELGHVVNRHGLRTLFQNSVISAVVIAMTGDVSSLTVGIPTLLMESKYSREFEEEADAFAVKLMTEHGMNPKYFAGMLKKLGGEHDEKTGKILNYISTHPATADRIKEIMKEAEGGE